MVSIATERGSVKDSLNYSRRDGFGQFLKTLMILNTFGGVCRLTKKEKADVLEVFKVDRPLKPSRKERKDNTKEQKRNRSQCLFLSQNMFFIQTNKGVRKRRESYAVMNVYYTNTIPFIVPFTKASLFFVLSAVLEKLLNFK